MTAVLLGAGAVVFGIYLVRGQGISTRAVVDRISAETASTQSVERLQALASEDPAPRAALVAAFMAAQAAAIRRYGAIEGPQQFARTLEAIGFDAGSVSAPLLGSIGPAKFYRDWVVSGTTAYDITAETRASFHLDDRVQTVTTTKKNGKQAVTTEVPRGGVLQVVTPSAAQAYRVGPHQVADARRLADQINLRAEGLRESSAALIQGQASAEAERIRAIANPETAKALQNLQTLLYSRVISDEEFERMKGKLLADPGSAG